MPPDLVPVEEARARILAAFAPLPAEQVALADALGRVLAEPVVARRTQPPADVSAMDGYAVRSEDVREAPVSLRKVGESPAGGAFEGVVGAGEAVRIFTGAPVPAGADCIVIQEDTESDGAEVTVKKAGVAGRYIRKAGLDFRAGETGVPAGRVLTARDIALAAAMDRPWLNVRRKPRVAVLATGDEVVMPGEPVGPNQIVSSNTLALAALIEASGGEAVLLGIAPDRADALAAMAAGARGHDLLVTTGGVSVGERDLVREALGESLDLHFWRIAMRPGKPLLFGTLAGTPVLGLPGNPVSSFVCGLVFLHPALGVMLGADLDAGTDGPRSARLAAPLAANDLRQDYLRARVARDASGLVAEAFAIQDSSVLSLLARSDGLIVRPPHAPAAAAGDTVEVLLFPAGPVRF